MQPNKRDFARISREAWAVYHYAGKAAYPFCDENKEHFADEFDSALKTIAQTAGFRLVPANDRETEDA